MASIYLVEDDDAMRESVAGYLQLEDHQVFDFATLTETRIALKTQIPELIIMDITLPDGDGFLFAKEILAEHAIPLIFMSGRESESDRITGFEIGADDYIVKPFSAKELVLRIAAILKRTLPSDSLPSTGTVWMLNGNRLRIDESSHVVTVNGKILRLTVTEWKILQYLISNDGSVIGRDQILDRCLDYSFEGYDRIVDTHIKNLRSKMGQAEWIETVRGYGYRFAGKSGS